MGTLDGKVALVTGAGQGVGQGIAYALSGEGAAVVVAGRTLSKVQATADEIAGRGGRAYASACDVKDEADIVRCVDETISTFGTVDILVNNAQEVTLGPLLDMTRDNFQDSWLSGPVASFSFMKACHEHLKDGGVIINLATSASLRLDPMGYGVYGSVKDATRILSRVAATEWGADGIRVICLMPLAASPAYQGWEQFDPDGAAQFRAGIPLRYVGDCEEDIGRAVVMFCGSDARYITGCTISVDGGQAYLR
jgi:NAD(P)-dependent dehydrogenase (short-subunit alcohol dehydrogenase family)